MQVPVVKVGEIVTFTYETSSRRSVPTNPKITRVRSDVSWDDVVINAAKEQKFLKGSLLNLSLLLYLPPFRSFSKNSV